MCIRDRHKAAYKQLLDNTNLEICAANDRGEWLRVQGTANFDNSPEAQAAAFQMCIRDSSTPRGGVKTLPTSRFLRAVGADSIAACARSRQRKNAPVRRNAHRGIGFT